MFTLTVSLDSLALYIVAADVIVLFSYILYKINQKRQLDKAVNKITSFIAEYFSNSGAAVRVSCFKLAGGQLNFVTLIESEPLKRFRYSIILETNLISHIHETTGLVIEKIYWRFPIKPSREGIAEPDGGNAEDDTYFSDAYTLGKARGIYQVSETSWDQYENSKIKK